MTFLKNHSDMMVICGLGMIFGIIAWIFKSWIVSSICFIGFLVYSYFVLSKHKDSKEKK